MSEPDPGKPRGDPPPPAHRPGMVDWLWIATAALVLLLGARIWATPAGRAMLGPPTTPADRVNPDLARQWRLLQSCATLIPDDATYTVRAPRAEDEMTLHMMSLAVIGHGEARPSSYYGRSLPDVGRSASYVIVFGDASLPDSGSELVARLDDGSLWRRSRPADS